MDNILEFKVDSMRSDVHEIISLDLINFNGQSISLKDLFSEISLQESIFLPFCSGYITVLESHNVFEDLPITGEETLKISYKGLHSDIIDREFYVYSLSTAASEIGAMAAHKLMFCSYETMINKSKRVSRAFTNMTPSNVIKAIVRTELDSKKDVHVEDSTNTVNYISPNVTPFAIAASMAPRAHNAAIPSGGLYLFYESADGFNFRSIESLLDGDTFNYKISEQGLGDNVFNDDSIVLKHSFVSPINTVNNITSGVMGNNIQMLDLDNRTMSSAGFDYFDDAQYKSVKKIERGDPESRFVSSNFKLKTTQGINAVMVGTDVTRDATIGRRQNRLATLKSGPRVHIEVPINFAMRAGSLIKLHMPTRLVIDNKLKTDDVFLTGVYLVTACRHIFSQHSGTTAIELVKDSYAVKRDDPTILKDGMERLGL